MKKLLVSMVALFVLGGCQSNEVTTEYLMGNVWQGDLTNVLKTQNIDDTFYIKIKFNDGYTRHKIDFDDFYDKFILAQQANEDYQDTPFVRSMVEMKLGMYLDGAALYELNDSHLTIIDPFLGVEDFEFELKKTKKGFNADIDGIVIEFVEAEAYDFSK